MRAAGKLLALTMHPEDAEGESSVDGGLRLVGADAEDCEGRLPLAQQSAGVHGAARVFEVGTIGESLDFVAVEFAQQNALEDLFVASSDGAQGSGGTLATVSANFHDRGL